ncbi:MAG: hypothetical protein HC914_20815, partial [Chloroflexaceae bacterium]|nr:hypothetical protein [Chloroflexaceae bacterium]
MPDTLQDLEHLRRLLNNARENLRLIEERTAEFVLSTDIPLLMVREERELRGDHRRPGTAHQRASIGPCG